MTSAVRLRASAMRDEMYSSPSSSERLRTLPFGAIGTGSTAAPNLVLIFAGTRPECIKLAPVVRALGGHPELSMLLVNSGQHRSAVRACLAEFGLKADVELDALPALPNIAASHQHLRVELAAVVRRFDPDLVLVQGDTLTAYSAACAARDMSYRLAHLEAGLRTDAMLEPFPEEWFRRRIAKFAQIHFAPSRSAVENLLAEGVDDCAVHHVGNTGIDSLQQVLDNSEHRLRRRQRVRNTVLVTLHRRANYDRNAAIVCDALIELASVRKHLRILFPVHPNPRVSATVRGRLESHPSIDLVEPMRYQQFIDCAERAALIISDSGGIQEEAPHLGTPLLVPRRNTERPESIVTGFVQLIPIDRDTIVRAALDVLASPRRLALPIDERAPFGAGNAASRVVSVLETTLLSQAYA
jgi:UDP-N-acetylglucosamine 2-epimerase (non-hydrolysing)